MAAGLGSGVTPGLVVHGCWPGLGTRTGAPCSVPLSLPGWLALGFLELSVVKFFSLQDQQRGGKQWERGQLCFEACHQVKGKGTGGGGSGITLGAGALGFGATARGWEPVRPGAGSGSDGRGGARGRRPVWASALCWV